MKTLLNIVENIFSIIGFVTVLFVVLFVIIDDKKVKKL